MSHKVHQLYLCLRGRVQGINLRFMVIGEARSLQLRGYVQNMNDGSVEIRAQGAKKNLELFIQWLRQNPGLSRIDDMETQWETPEPYFKDFQIRY